jgi:L-ascorbate metabolism protein UlaG (beta-lactamase superfamily)
VFLIDHNFQGAEGMGHSDIVGAHAHTAGGDIRLSPGGPHAERHGRPLNRPMPGAKAFPHQNIFPLKGGNRMTLQVTWYSHACLMIDTGDAKLIVDPFLTGNPLAPVSADEVQADYILVSHGHGDHVGDTVAIAQRTGATVISNFEIHNWLVGQGLEKAHPQHIGGGFDFPWGRVKLTIAHHGSSLPDGSYGGNPCGFLFYIQGRKIYHACDTGLFYDMKLIGEEGIDLAVLPIGDNFTMGPEDSLRAVQLIAPRQVLPIHYDTFDVIQQDAAAWKTRVEDETAARVALLKPGETLDLS